MALGAQRGLTVPAHLLVGGQLPLHVKFVYKLDFACIPPCLVIQNVSI